MAPGRPTRSKPACLGTVSGQIKVKAAQVALTSKLSARDLHAVLDFNRSELAVADIDGALAGGRIGGDFGFERGDEGVTGARPFQVGRRRCRRIARRRRQGPIVRQADGRSRARRQRTQPDRVDRLARGHGNIRAAGRGRRPLRSGGVRYRDPRGRSGSSDRRDADRRAHGGRAGDQRLAGPAGGGIDRGQHGTIAPGRSGGACQGRRIGADRKHRSHPKRHRCAFGAVGPQIALVATPRSAAIRTSRSA